MLEDLFGWTLRTGKKIFSKSSENPLSPSAVSFDDVQNRLSLVARALSETPIKIKEAEHLGGNSGDVVFLPSYMGLSPTDRSLNESAYLYRLVYSLTAGQLGFYLPDRSPGGDYSVFLSLLAVPSVSKASANLYPSLQDLAKVLYANQANVSTATDVRLRAEFYRVWINALLQRETPDAERSPHVREILNRVLLFSAKDTQEFFFIAEKEWNALTRLLPKAGAFREVKIPSIWGLLLNKIVTQVDEDLTEPEQRFASKSLPAGTEIKSKPKEKVEKKKLKKDVEENPVIHSFEKVHTVDSYQGGNRNPDGSDELQEQSEALNEIDMNTVVRTDETAASIYKADLMLNATTADLEESIDPQISRFVYDEWEGKSRSYRKSWCTVFEETNPAAFKDVELAAERAKFEQKYKKKIQLLERELSFLMTSRKWINRQLEGPEVDIDALVDRYSSYLSGHTGPEKLYCRRTKRHRDLAAFIVLDMSLSTDSWIENRRVLDVARDSVLMLSRILQNFGQQIGVSAFYSYTRKDCHYTVIKGTQEDWKNMDARLFALKPSGYTRIGPALRHTTELLKKTPAKKKIMILLSDGKPTDYDHYEGQYGIQDVRQALIEASQSHIRSFAFAIDSKAKFYLPQMFGEGHFQILPHPDLLSLHLARIFKSLLA